MTPRGSYRLPWVRLHAIRDYYSMAALVARYPNIRVSFNLTPVLLAQLEDYARHGATDRHLDLTLTPAENLVPDERRELVASFFDADWHHMVLRHQRYGELFRAAKRKRGLTVQELRDLQMWSNLAWFGTQFQAGAVELVTGEVVRVDDLVRRARDFAAEDIERMVEEQGKILRAVVPLHRTLQEKGQIEVATSPYFHPILPLLIDTGAATVDRDGATLPSRFQEPEDAATQVRMAVACYERCFGRPPAGMWPAEGAISAATIPLFAGAGIRWIGSDAGVLAQSGPWGYPVDQPEIACQAYRVEERGWTLAAFFRDSQLSDWIGFEGQRIDDPTEAAERFVAEIHRRVGDRLPSDRPYVLPLVLDGENAWGAYPESGAPFLAALYDHLSADPLIATTTFSDWLSGRDGAMAAHPIEGLPRVHELHTGSWIDEPGSRPGVDLGTWIGEPEENRAWELLARVRRDVRAAGFSPADGPELAKGLLAAEGSDWFWWFGEDQT
ncbi:MAG: glycoside hydrolase family 57 protein, partial [Gemmatimonadales bacterium]|nr:glycoside hydrolase family 57 protein [Gemmatimonadales bacterium]